MKPYYSSGQLISLTFLRVLIGWHFLYEGLAKLYDPVWSSKPYLSGAIGPFAPVFKSMASNEALLRVADVLNVWGLILIGFGLFVGLLAKPAKIFGILLLSFYYLSYPPFAGLGINEHVEGTYWIVNKNLIEISALLILVFFPTSRITGIDRFFLKTKRQPVAV